MEQDKEQEFYYIDRPPVPSTQQVLVNISAIKEHSVLVSASDIGPWFAQAVEVKGEDAHAIGVLAFFEGIDYETLVAAPTDIANAHVDWSQVEYEYEGKSFAADESVASALDDVEAYQSGAEIDAKKLIADLASVIVSLQIRNNIQRDMLQEQHHASKGADTDDDL